MDDVFMECVLKIALCLLVVNPPNIRFVVCEKPLLRFLNEELEFAHIPMRDVEGLRIFRGDLRFS
jgi:hypothetical protein